MKLMGHILLTRDPHAPFKSTTTQCDQTRQDNEILASRKALQESTGRFCSKYGKIAAARRRVKEDQTLQRTLRALEWQRQDHNSLYKRKLTALFKTFRQEYFAILGAACLENQHTG